MSARLDKLSVSKLGPLGTFSFDFANLNLIYGRNESGKTYLVEFILHSLFRHKSKWPLRDVSSDGYISVSGIEEKSVKFSPSSAKKIEDYWDEKDLGLPLNMSRLLVVKGGDLNLADNVPGGVNREFLKTALTSQVVLDEIWKEIPATIQNASIRDQQITGSNQGKIKEYNNTKQDHLILANLLEAIEEKYSRGPASLLEIEITKTKSELNVQYQAKCHQAYLISLEKKTLVADKKLISDEALTNLRDQIRDYKNRQKNIDNLLKKEQNSKQDCENYLWLETAASVWEAGNLDTKGKPSPLIAIIGGVLLAGGLVVLGLDQFLSGIRLFWPGLLSSIIGTCLIMYFLALVFRWSSSFKESSERLQIQSSFRERFGETPRGLAEIRLQKNKLQEFYLLSKSTRDLLNQEILETEKLILIVNGLFQDLVNKPVDIMKWDDIYQVLKTKSMDLTEQIHQLDLDLSKLNIPDEDYSSKPGDLVYDPKTTAHLEVYLDEMEAELSSYYKDLDSMKIRACDQTGDKITASWPEIFHNLQQKHIELADLIKLQTAEIIAKIGLNEVLTRIQSEEDEKIRQDLNTPEVSKIMATLTGRYQDLDLVENQLIVSSQTNQYPLENLSTGAREQIQLALRLGITSHLSGGDPLFLVLDDAFQHSDWNRRITLVKSMVALVKEGWQVTYLSMDDHIRDLFLKEGKSALKSQFHFIDIPD